MKENKPLSVISQMNMLYLYSGAAWILGGIFMLLNDSILFTILECIAMLVIVVSHIFVMRAKKESQDELSIRNYDKARSHALTYMHIVVFLMVIALQIIGTFFYDNPISIDVKGLLIPCFFIGIGIEYIITGILFRKYERDGDECIY